MIKKENTFNFSFLDDIPSVVSNKLIKICGLKDDGNSKREINEFINLIDEYVEGKNKSLNTSNPNIRKHSLNIQGRYSQKKLKNFSIKPIKRDE